MASQSICNFYTEWANRYVEKMCEGDGWKRGGGANMKVYPHEVAGLKERFPAGTRVELVRMNDPYSSKPVPGDKGTVQAVDDIGTIHVAWDCGSSLGVVYGEDVVRKI